MSPRIDYVREYRVLGTQIDKLSALIRAGQARLARSGECTTEEAHAMNELRVELAQRRKRRAELEGNVQRNLDKQTARMGVKPRLDQTHVIVGDHDPEPRSRYGTNWPDTCEVKTGRSTGYLIHPRGPDYPDFTRELRDKPRAPQGMLRDKTPDYGLRAVATTPHAESAAYHGQWLHVDVWRTVVNPSGLPIIYSSQRAAIEAARWVRSQITDPKARRA